MSEERDRDLQAGARPSARRCEQAGDDGEHDQHARLRQCDRHGERGHRRDDRGQRQLSDVARRRSQTSGCASRRRGRAPAATFIRRSACARPAPPVERGEAVALEFARRGEVGDDAEHRRAWTGARASAARCAETSREWPTRATITIPSTSAQQRHDVAHLERRRTRRSARSRTARQAIAAARQRPAARAAPGGFGTDASPASRNSEPTRSCVGGAARRPPSSPRHALRRPQAHALQRLLDVEPAR